MAERALDLSKIEECGDVISRPAFQNNKIYFGASDSYFYCVDAKTGQKVWNLKTGGIIFASPLLHNGVAYFGSFDQYLYAVDIKSKSVLWKIKTGGLVASSPAIYGDIIFFGSSDTYFYAVSIRNRDVIWKFKTGDEIVCDPAVFDGKIYFGSMDGYFYCLDISGKLLWKFKTGDSIILGMPLVTEDTVCFGSADNNLYCLTPEGDFKWAVRTGDMVCNNASLYDGILYFGSRDRHLYALDAKNGNVLWKAMTGIHILISRPIKVYDKIYVGSEKLYCFSLNGQKIWTSEPCDIVPGGPVFYEGNLYFGCADSYVRCISAEDGHIIWRFQPNNKKIVSLVGVIRALSWNPEFFKQRDEKLAGKLPMPPEPYGISKDLIYGLGLGLVDLDDLSKKEKYAHVSNAYSEIQFGGSYLSGGAKPEDKEKILKKFNIGG